MQELTEREQKLMGYLGKLISATTITAIYLDRLNSYTKQINDWRNGAFESIGFTSEWQNELLHELENEFGLKYAKLDPETLKETESDGDQTS